MAESKDKTMAKPVGGVKNREKLIICNVICNDSSDVTQPSLNMLLLLLLMSEHHKSCSWLLNIGTPNLLRIKKQKNKKQKQKKQKHKTKTKTKKLQQRHSDVTNPLWYYFS